MPRGGKLDNAQKMRGSARVPENPTGRFVETRIGAKNGGVLISHWLPAHGTSWQCPTCQQMFERDMDIMGVPWHATPADVSV